MGKDYIPQSPDAYNAWQGNFVDETSANLQNWGIDAQIFQPVLDEQTEWDKVYPKAVNPQNRTQADVTARTEKQSSYTEVIRTFVNQQIQNNPKVTDADRNRLGVPVHSTVRTPSPVPSTVPVVDIVTGHQQHIIHFSNEGSAGKGKPVGVHGCEIWMKKGTQPENDSELSFVATDTATPYTLKFDTADMGIMVYYRLRWVNTRGEVGAWSALVNAVVS